MTGLTVAADAEGAAEAAAHVLGRLIGEARAARGVAHVALAGGSTPRRAYELLAARTADPQGLELWFTDERAVPPDHPDSNYAMVHGALLADLPVPASRVHRIMGELPPREAAARYEEALASTVPSNEDGVPALDVALLGLGEDGHTASLFPGHPALDAADALCVAVEGAPEPLAERVSLTLRTLGAARHLVFLATGEGKRPAAEAFLAGPDPGVPASLLAGRDCDLIVDTDAAPEGELDEPAGASGVHHVALETRPADVDACLAFYRVLGFRETPPPPSLEGRTAWLERQGLHVHLLLTDDPVVPPRGHFAVALDDYEGTIADLVRGGHEPPEARPRHWGAPRSFARDPAGHLVELMASPPP